MGGENMAAEQHTPVTMDILEIQKWLPHRYPFLLIDKVLDLVPDQYILAMKNVTMNEGFFQGHFPNNPVMPGVLICESYSKRRIFTWWARTTSSGRRWSFQEIRFESACEACARETRYGSWRGT